MDKPVESQQQLSPIATLPHAFVKNIDGVFKERGRAWLDDLPHFLKAIAEEWALTLLPAFPILTFNYVTPVILRDGTKAVLKAGVPNPEGANEIAALQLYDGHGAVRLLRSDAARGVFLMEQVEPGTVLTAWASEVRDTEATQIAATVMRSLWRPVPIGHSFPTTAQWSGGLDRLRAHFGGSTGPLPEPLVSQAETLFHDLLASQTEQVLLHGDLHHDNILSATREAWLAIDPKGLVGEPAYEVGAILRNLWGDRHTITDPRRLIQRRVNQFAEELAVDRERIRAWGLAQSVLSAWWCIDDGGDCWKGSIEIAEMIAAT